MIRIKKKKNLFLYIYVFIGVVISSVGYINIENLVTTQQYNVAPVGEIIKDMKLTQKINIPSNLKKYGIPIATYGRTNSGYINIRIIQGDRILEEKINVSTVKDNQIRYLKMDFSKLKKGEALLEIEGVDGSIGNAVTTYMTDDISLGRLNINGVITNHGIINEYKYFKIDKIVKIQFLFLFLMTLSFIYFIKSYENNKKRYFATVAIIFFIINIKAPTMTFAIEPFGEVVENFLYYGENNGIFYNLFRSDAGYWPLFQRIFSLFVIKVFPFSVYYKVLIIQYFGILFIASISSLFVLDSFKKYGSVIFRFTISLIISTFAIVPFTETYPFINYTYFGLIGIILISLLDLDKIKKKNYILIVTFCFFICLSKSHYVILLPVIVLAYIFFRKNISKRYFYFLLSLVISTIFQIIYILFHSTQKINNNETFSNLVKITSHQVIQQIRYIFFPEISGYSNIKNANILFLFIFLILAISSFYFLIKNKNKESVVMIALIMIIVGTILYNLIGNIWFNDNSIVWLENSTRFSSRHFIFVVFSIIYLLILLLYNIFTMLKKENFNLADSVSYKITYAIIIVFFITRFTIYDNNFLVPNKMTYSDWKIYSKFYNKNSYLIPIEPVQMNRFTFKNVNVYFIGHNNLFAEFLQANFKDYCKDHFFITIMGSEIHQLHELSLEKPVNISYLYTERLRENNFNKLKLIGYNENGEIVVELDQLNDKNKLYVGFRNYNNEKIVKIKFFDENMNPEYVKPHVLIGEESNYKYPYHFDMYVK